ncbi:uncharacterized protein LOC143878173 [Tasmannia lanceolata]|uniref:uncharacterized protein LOC143878173 n=1 Tax=Tasmannia lanceolata TaxID=3420 RepID=UPI00406299E3
MATSAFKSTTKRTQMGSSSNTGGGDAGSSNRGRSRSVSRFSDRSGRFVNTERGSGFPEISLDDLANELFLAKEEDGARGRSGRRLSAISPSGTTLDGDASIRRGRSVSRNHGKGNFDINKDISDCNSRRNRSVSVARYHHCSDSESDMDRSHNPINHTKSKCFSRGTFQRPSLHNPTGPNHHVLRRSLSQKDILQSHDGYSSYSSALTDDEAQDARCHKNGIEKTIRAVYAQKKSEHPTEDGVENGLFEAMRKEFRHAVEQIRTELEQVMVKTPAMLANSDCLESKGPDVIQAIAEIRKNYTTKLEQSENRTKDLLAELAVEEQRGHEFSNIVRELLPEQKQFAMPGKPSRTRKRSNDRSRVSKRLTEEAEKYFEDFISNVEDTDLSSFDGEKSDASSTVGGSRKSRDPAVIQCVKSEIVGNPARASSLPVEMDGVVLPWLQWETSNDSSPLPFKSKECSVASGSNIFNAAQEASARQSNSNCLHSSRGSWSPDYNDSSCAVSREKAGSRFIMESSGECGVSKDGGSSFDMDGYLNVGGAQDHLLFERFRHRHRIQSGGLLLCATTFL